MCVGSNDYMQENAVEELDLASTLAWTESTIMVDIRPSNMIGQEQPQNRMQNAECDVCSCAPRSLFTGDSQALTTQTSCLKHAAVFLSDASREVLLQMVVPLHSNISARNVVIMQYPESSSIGDLPMGAEVQLSCTGAAADHKLQVVSVTLPQWLPSHPEGKGRFIIVSKSETSLLQEYEDARKLIEDGQAGLNTCFHAFTEPLLMYGQVGIETSDHRVIFSIRDIPNNLVGAASTSTEGLASLNKDQQNADFKLQIAENNQLKVQKPIMSNPPRVISQQGPSYFPSGSSAKSLSLTGQKLDDRQHISADTLKSVSAFNHGSQASKTNMSFTPSSSKSIPLGQFLQPLSVIGGGKAPIKDQRKGQKVKFRQLESLKITTNSAAADISSGRVVCRQDIELGDYVEIHQLGSAVHGGTDQGFIAEVMVEDDFQQAGVLVRLHNDSMGHIIRMIGKKGPAAAAAATLHAKQLRGDLTESLLLSRDKPSGTPAEALDKALTDPPITFEDSINVSWKEYEQQYGAALTACILDDSGGNMELAISTLQEQSNLLSSADGVSALDELVARAVGRAESSAEASLAEQRKQDLTIRQKKRELSAAEHKRPIQEGGWGNALGASSIGVMSGVANSGSRSVASIGDDFGPPAGSGTSSACTVPSLWNGPIFPDRRLAPCPTPSRVAIINPTPSATGSGFMKAPSPQPKKLLKRPDSIATVAAQSNVNIKAAESLRHLLPGYSSRAVVEALNASNGNIEIAADRLLASGPPTEFEEATAAVILGGESSSENEEESNREGSSEKIAELVHSFQGLDLCLAEFLLHQCGGDFQSTCKYIQEQVLGGSPARTPDGLHALQLQGQVGRHADRQAQKNIAAPLVTMPGDVSWITMARKPPHPKTLESSARSNNRRPEPVSGRGSARGDASSRRTTSSAARSTFDDETRNKARLEAERTRRVAQVYYDARNLYFNQAASAYRSGDGRLAAELSRRGKEMGELAKHHRIMSNDAAYRSSNMEIRNQYVIDLHHMFVEEALAVLRRTLQTLQGLDHGPEGMELKVITGRGSHSVNGIPLIKQAVLGFLKEQDVRHWIDSHNEGVVIVGLGRK